MPHSEEGMEMSSKVVRVGIMEIIKILDFIIFFGVHI